MRWELSSFGSVWVVRARARARVAGEALHTSSLATFQHDPGEEHTLSTTISHNVDTQLNFENETNNKKERGCLDL